MSTTLAILTMGLSLSAAVGLAVAAPPADDLRPWPAQYKIKPDQAPQLTPADVVGPDGIVYPNWTRCGVQGGIPEVQRFATIEAYGGQADDAVDDAAALERACEAAGKNGGGAILLGEGTYHLDRPVTVRSDQVVIRGQGAGKTKLLFRYALPADGIAFFWPPSGSRVGRNTRLELHARPSGLAKMRILIEDRELAVWTRGQHSGNTFSFAGSARKAIGQIPDGPRRLQGIAEYTDGTRRSTEIPILLDAAFDDTRPVPDARGAITFAGRGWQGPELKLAEDGRRGDLVLHLQRVEGLRAGDGILIEGPATDRWKQLTENACQWGMYRRYEAVVEKIEGSSVTLSQPLRLEFPVVDGSYVQKVAPIQRCGVEGFYLEQTENLWISSVLFSHAWNCWARGVTVKMCGRFPVYGSQAKWCEIRDCLFDDAWFKGGGGTAYTGWDGCWDCLMENVETRKMRHAPLFQWAASGNVIRKSLFRESDGQWHAGWCNENLFEQCRIESVADHGAYGYGFWASPPNDAAHGPNGPRNVVYNCDVSSPKTGLWMGGMNENWLILHNRFVVERGQGVYAGTASFDHIIQGNVFVLKDNKSPMLFLSRSNCVGVEVRDNRLYGGNGQIASGPAQPLVIEGNQAFPLGDSPRPEPAVPSIYEWQLSQAKAAAAAKPLPQTQPLLWEEADLSGRLMDGAHQFVERTIAEAPAKRRQFWARDFSSAEAYARSVQPNRERFGEILGAGDPRLPPRLERFAEESDPLLVAETPRYRVFQVRWAVLDELSGEGLLAQPKGPPVARGIFVPDASQTPEQWLGLAPGIPPAAQAARRLAENGVELILPATINREKLRTEDKQLRASDQTHREWIYRQAFHMGRHIIGYEVQTVRAAVDWFQTRTPAGGKTGLCGYGEGGLVALYAAALDPRIDATLVSGYFDSRQQVWAEPIYRNVWGLLREFGDAELAALILPRALVIEHSAIPEVTGHKGALHTPAFASLSAEAQRIETGPHFSRPLLVHGAGGEPVGPFSEPAQAAFAQRLGMGELAPASDTLPVDARAVFDPGARHQRLFQAMENHVQRLVRRSEHVRDRLFLHQIMPELADNRWSTERRHATHPPEKFIEGAKAFRRQVQEEAMGRFDEPLLPCNARTRKVAESARWTAYDVVLDVWPEVFAWGVLVLPKDLKPGEQRPVVVCQHGRDGLPRDTLDGNKTAYNNFAGALAERGFITFAPHNLYRGEDRYRWLDRKANTVKATLFSFIIAQHDQILRWLVTLPFVDGRRIAFYGLSYGGETAVRVPAILESYCLSICSGDFNQWTRKVAATDQPFSFMRTIEWEMPYWNLGHTFDYAEMAYLMVPRPFMVERGHLDRVGRDAWVAHEYAKVRWLYAQLGLADRTAIEYFQGGHSINGEGTFDFLHHHLNWPKP